MPRGDISRYTGDRIVKSAIDRWFKKNRKKKSSVDVNAIK